MIQDIFKYKGQGMDNINHFLASYTIEVIVFVITIMILLFIVILKQKKDHPQDLVAHEEKVIQVQKNRKKESIASKNESFAPTQTVPTIEETTFEKNIQPKRDIPKHGPITKEHFTIFKGAKLLIAEDNIINQKVINGILGDSGIKIIMANNGQEALDILKQEKDIYIVLMDAHMPIVDGFEATKLIRANSTLNHLLVVALSGDTAADDIKKMKNAGMQEYLEKPLKIDKLYDILYGYIDIVDGIKFDTPSMKSSNLLHVEQGIEICGGDVELFKEILLEFVTMYEDADKQISSFVHNNNLNAAQRLLLDIAGISANIGAPELSEIATRFREELNNEEKNFTQNEKNFSTYLRELLNQIKNYIR